MKSSIRRHNRVRANVVNLGNFSISHGNLGAMIRYHGIRCLPLALVLSDPEKTCDDQAARHSRRGAHGTG